MLLGVEQDTALEDNKRNHLEQDEVSQTSSYHLWDPTWKSEFIKYSAIWDTLDKECKCSVGNIEMN
jgi:hypothetical protein